MAHRKREVKAWAADGDPRSRELLRVAARNFAENGYRGTSLETIADQFGVLKSSLYHYIRGKDDLLFEVVASVHQRGIANLRAIAASETDPVERLRAVVRGHLRFIADNLAETTVFLHEIDQLPELRRRQIPSQVFTDLFSDLVADGQRSRALKADIPPRVCALILLGAANWSYRWLRADGPSTPAQLADDYARVLVDGLLEREFTESRSPVAAIPCENGE